MQMMKKSSTRLPIACLGFVCSQKTTSRKTVSEFSHVNTLVKENEILVNSKTSPTENNSCFSKVEVINSPTANKTREEPRAQNCHVHAQSTLLIGNHHHKATVTDHLYLLAHSLSTMFSCRALSPLHHHHHYNTFTSLPPSLPPHMIFT